MSTDPPRPTPRPDIGPPLLTVDEIAQYLRIARTTVYELAKSGKLKHYRVGPGTGAIRVSVPQFREFMESVSTGEPAVEEPPIKRKHTIPRRMGTRGKKKT